MILKSVLTWRLILVILSRLMWRDVTSADLCWPQLTPVDLGWPLLCRPSVTGSRNVTAEIWVCAGNVIESFCSHRVLEGNWSCQPAEFTFFLMENKIKCVILFYGFNVDENKHSFGTSSRSSCTRKQSIPFLNNSDNVQLFNLKTAKIPIESHFWV